MRTRALRFLLLVALTLVLAPTPVAHAASIVVNSAADTTVNNGLCTLREAIINTNNNAATWPDCAAGSGADTITFSFGLVVRTITLVTWLPNITDAAGLTIDGPRQGVTISGGGAYPVMQVYTGASLTLNNLTIANGNATSGGGIYIDPGATLTVTNSTFSGNKATAGGGPGGGGIANFGTVTITNSTFSGNSANTSGGGIYNNNGTLTITNSTFFDNVADSGGGIDQDAGTVTITSSTFSGNVAGAGGGIDQNAGTVTLRNTIVANSAIGGNCSGTIINGGNNIDDSTDCNWGSTNGSKSNTNPQLGSHANNGGPTQTFAFLTSSPAINAGNAATCAAAPVNNLDQRGFARRSGFCDIGAFEAQPASLTNTGGSPQSATINSDFVSALQVNVKDANTNNLGGVVVDYTAPGSGASANLSSGTATTNASGNASVTATANGTTGGPYIVSAATSGLTANFSLTNTNAALFLPLILR